MILNESLHRILVKWQVLNKFSVKWTLHGAQMLTNKWGIEDYQKMIFLAKNYNMGRHYLHKFYVFTAL